MLEKMKASLEQSVVAQIKQSVVTQIKEIAKKEMSEYLLHFKQETQYEERPISIDSGEPESIESEPKRYFINTSPFEERQQAVEGISGKSRQHQDNLNNQRHILHAYSATSMPRFDLNTSLYPPFTTEKEDTK